MVTTIIISIILLCIDQISKLLVVNLLTKTNSITIIKNFFYLTYINNDGAAFSILVGKRIFLILIAVLVIVMLIRYIKKNNIQNKLELVSLALIIGGSLGNLMDRVVRGYVIDFLDFKLFNYNFPIFNLADTFIVIGVFLLLLKEIRKDKVPADFKDLWLFKKDVKIEDLKFADGEVIDAKWVTIEEFLQIKENNEIISTIDFGREEYDLALEKMSTK